MSFGRNPHVPKAQVAEQKAADAPDDASRRRAHRDAAHQWERAAERERPGKQRTEYEQNAERNRGIADGVEPAENDDADAPAEKSAPIDPRALN